MKKNGIFIKVFLYTILFSVLLVFTAAALFGRQFQTYYSRYQFQQIVDSYQRLVDRSHGEDDIAEIAQQFYARNESFQFYITDSTGQIVYETPDMDMSNIKTGVPAPGFQSSTITVRLDRNYNLHALKDDVFLPDFSRWITRLALASAAMLGVCILCAFIFARQITKPIQVLAENTNKMANLKDVPPPPERKDEVGTLARDIHSMYVRLKETITRLEDEIIRERALEETQRYFFAAASHELKTPIAATSVLLEGMHENIGDYKDHSKYLRECMKMMDAQSKIISEILELVSLNDGKIVSAAEPLDLKRTIADILLDFQTLAEANAQRIITDIPTGQIVLSDPKLLQKVLSNVILNAVQNTPKGAEIRIWSEPAAEKSRLCVLNTGVHIDDAALAKLFDPFYRIDQARSRTSGRSGLGLTIVQKALEAMSIEYALENTPDGVLFRMDLPLPCCGTSALPK